MKARMALALGVDINTVTEDGRWAGLTIAAANNALDILDWLLQLPGLDVNIRSHGDYGSLWSDARQRELRHLYKDEVVARNWTALMFACAKGHSEAVYKLSQAPGVDLNAKSSPATSEMTAAHFALKYNKEDLSCVNILLKTPGVDWNLRDGRGYVPLVQTIIEGYLGPFKAVLSVPELDLNAEDNDGWTPLFWALKKGIGNEFVKLLLEKPGIDLKALTKGSLHLKKTFSY